MGKKSKKGVPRANTKKHQHHAAGHGKTASHKGHHHTNNTTTGSCDNSLDSTCAGVLNTKNLSSTVSFTPMPIVNVNHKQVLPPQSQHQHPAVAALAATDGANSKLLNLLRTISNKENSGTSSSTDSRMPSMTVISSNQPTVALFNIETGTVDDVIAAPDMMMMDPTFERQQSDVTKIEKEVASLSITDVGSSNIAAIDAPTTTETEMIPAKQQEQIVPIDEAVNSDDVAAPDQQKQPAVSENTPADVALKTEKEELGVDIPAPIGTVGSPDPQQIWSSTLRSIVSIDDDEEEVLADTSFSKNHSKAVMDVTPQKHSNSKLLVPIIQAVSPSPDHRPTSSFTGSTKQQQQQPNNLSYITTKDVPSLDTPDKKDLDQNDDTKQNLCCTIM